jgi:hypothetical protein
MLLVSPEYYERFHRDDAKDTAACKEMRILLKNKEAHSYDSWVNLRYVQDPLIRLARKRLSPIPLPFHGREAGGTVSRPTHVDMGIQAQDFADAHAVSDYVMPENEEFARYGDAHF